MPVSQQQTPPTPSADPSQLQPAHVMLTPRQQEAIRLRKDGLSFAEIGELLGCTEGAALHLVRRASAKLKQSGVGLLSLKTAAPVASGNRFS